MGKVEEYRALLKTLDNWEDFLLQESRLPGPRANLELAYAVAWEGSEELFLRLAALDPEEAPQNTAEEFLTFCGVLGLGYLAARAPWIAVIVIGFFDITLWLTGSWQSSLLIAIVIANLSQDIMRR